MLIFSNYSKSNISLQNINNSLMFQLYQKDQHKKLYYKSNNSIRGFYKDTVLNDFFYFSSNGLNTAIVRKKWINNHIFQPKSKTFVSYFFNLEDKFLRFNTYPGKYFRKSLKNYIFLNENITKIAQRYSEFKPLGVNKSLTFPSKNFINIKFLKTLKILKKLKNITNFFGILITSLQKKKYYFINKQGILKSTSKNFINDNFYGGITKLLSNRSKKCINNILSAEYHLLKYYSNILKKNYNPKKTLVTLILYQSFIRYNYLKLKWNLRRRRTTFRFSNWELYYIFGIHAKKTKRIFKMLFKVMKYTLMRKNYKQIWLKNYLYKLPWDNFKNNYLNNIKFLQEINKCTLKDKLLLFKSLIYKYQINLNNKIHNVVYNVRPLDNYLILKSKIFFEIIKKSKLPVKNFNYFTIESTLKDLLLNKINHFNQLFFISQNNTFSESEFNSHNIWKKSFDRKISKSNEVLIKNTYVNKLYRLNYNPSFSFIKLKWFFRKFGKRFLIFLKTAKPKLYNISKVRENQFFSLFKRKVKVSIRKIRRRVPKRKVLTFREQVIRKLSLDYYYNKKFSKRWRRYKQRRAYKFKKRFLKIVKKKTLLRPRIKRKERRFYKKQLKIIKMALWVAKLKRAKLSTTKRNKIGNVIVKKLFVIRKSKTANKNLISATEFTNRYKKQLIKIFKKIKKFKKVKQYRKTTKFISFKKRKNLIKLWKHYVKVLKYIKRNKLKVINLKKLKKPFKIQLLVKTKLKNKLKTKLKNKLQNKLKTKLKIKLKVKTKIKSKFKLKTKPKNKLKNNIKIVNNLQNNKNVQKHKKNIKKSFWKNKRKLLKKNKLYYLKFVAKRKLKKRLKKITFFKILEKNKNRLLSSNITDLGLNYKRFKKQTSRRFKGKFLDWWWKNPNEKPYKPRKNISEKPKRQSKIYKHNKSEKFNIFKKSNNQNTVRKIIDLKILKKKKFKNLNNNSFQKKTKKSLKVKTNNNSQTNLIYNKKLKRYEVPPKKLNKIKKLKQIKPYEHNSW